MVTVAALCTSHRITALCAPVPGGALMTFGLISKTTMFGRKAGAGVVTGAGVTVEDDDETETVTEDVTDPAELLAVNI